MASDDETEDLAAEEEIEKASILKSPLHSTIYLVNLQGR
jgi:hypothetical protein